MSSAIRYCIAILLMFSMAACDTAPRRVARGEVVNLYSNCLSTSDQALFAPFETASGLKVNIISEPDDQIFDRIEKLESDSTNADVLLLRGIENLYQAGQTGMLDTLPVSFFFNAIPAHLRDEQQAWLTLGYSAYAIAYRSDSLDSLQLQRYEQLTDESWDGSIALPIHNDIFYISLLASLMADEGKEMTQNWWSTLREARNTAVDSLSLLQLLNTSTYRSDPQWQLRFLQPEAYLQITGAAIRKAAPHPGRAEALFNYLFSREFMRRFAEKHRLYPSRPDVDIPSTLPRAGRFQADTTAQTRIGRLTEEARALLYSTEEEVTP